MKFLNTAKYVLIISVSLIVGSLFRGSKDLILLKSFDVQNSTDYNNLIRIIDNDMSVLTKSLSSTIQRVRNIKFKDDEQEVEKVDTEYLQILQQIKEKKE